MLFYILYFIITLFLSETVFRVSSLGSFAGITPFFAGFVLFAALFFALLCSLPGRRAGRALAFIFTALIFVFYSVNLVYQHIFRSFLSVAQYGMGGDAISTYRTETLIGISECWYFLLALLLPLAALIILTKKRSGKKTSEAKKDSSAEGSESPEESSAVSARSGRLARRRASGRLKKLAALAAAAAAVLALTVLALPLAGRESYSPYDIFHETFVLAMSQKSFGALPSTALEVRGLLFGTGTGKLDIDTDGPDDTDGPEVTEYGLNVTDIDFAALKESTDSDRLKALDDYFAARSATSKNEYTGMFEGYNVVVLLCESYSPYLLDAERTPMLYKMANEGFVFSDYYGTICDNTSNSEYTLITGLLPDTSLLGKGWTNFYDFNSCTTSKNNSLPYCLGNMLKAQGVRSLGFHYYWGSYYGRNKTHANFGYDMSFMGAGLKKSEDWPTSDLEMMKQAVPMLLKENENGEIERFGAYFLTFSGHMQYRFDTNRIARINKDVSDGLDMSAPTRAFVSCNQELEYAVEYMVEEFEKAGVLDNTVFVVLPDHYPYALGLKPLSELAGKDLLADSFEAEFNQYKGVLMIWSASMEEPVHVDVPCCELDVLPTLLNLFGFEYDSRLLMGTDIMSDSDHIAILADRSFVTENFFFNASDGTLRTRSSAEPPQEYVDRLTAMIKNKFTASTEMLYTDYYAHVFGGN